MAASQETARLSAGLAGALSSRGGRAFAAATIMTAPVTSLRRVPRLPGAFTVRAVAAGDEPALRAFSGQPAKVARLMASGDLGLIALSEGRIQAMEWIRPGPAEYDWDARRLGLVFHVPPRYCWLHNGSGGGVGPWAMVMGRLPLILEARGIDVACLQVASENVYSIQCHESLGFRRSGTAAALRLGQRPLVWLRTNGRMSLQFREMALDLHRLAPR